MNLRKTQQAIDGAISTFEYLIANDKAALNAALHKNQARLEEALQAIEAMRAMQVEKIKAYFAEVEEDLRERSRVRVEELQRACGEELPQAEIPNVILLKDEGTES
jgi:CHASE3 domain sensor protein